MKKKLTLRPSPTALLNPRCDPIFKALFTQNTRSSNAALADFISAMLGKTVHEVELQPNELPVDSLDGMQMAFDVSVIFDDGERADIEMQGRSYDYDYAARSEIQCARLLNIANKKGGGWKAPKVYQISVLNFTFDRTDKSPFCWYTMAKDSGEGRKRLAGLLNVLFLELPKIRVLLAEPPEKLTKIEKWGLFLAFADDPEQVEKMYRLVDKEEGIMSAKKVLSTVSADESNWWIQNSYYIAQHDREEAEINAARRLARATEAAAQQGLQKGFQQGIAQGMEQGIAQGIEQGIAQGIAQGDHDARLKFAAKYKASGHSVAETADFFGLPPELVETLQ